MHIAAKEGFTEMCKLLVSKGVDANIRDKYGFSASYWAKQNRHREIMDLLPNPLRITKEEYMEHMNKYWEAHGKPSAGKKKKGKGKKKK